MYPIPLPRSQRRIVLIVATTCATALFIYSSFDNSFFTSSSKYIEHFSSNYRQSFSEKSDASKFTSVFEPKWTYEYTLSLCKGDTDKMMAEDLFCKKRPEFLPNYKAPCWMETDMLGNKTVQCMPYFHLLGAEKCGSTDLFARIVKHPEIEPPNCFLHKECFYWSWTRCGIKVRETNLEKRTTFREYLNYYNQASQSIDLREVDGYHSHVTGEGTPADLCDFRGWQRIPQNEHLNEPLIMTPHLMKHMYPDPKLIVILRNPADRLYSDFYFHSKGSSPEQFHKDATRAVNMLENCAKTRSMKLCIFDKDVFANFPIRTHISCYSIFMKEWLRVFPRESFLVLRNEDYSDDIKKTMKMIFNFLNLSSVPDHEMDILSNAQRSRVTQSKKDKGPMMKATREMLDRFFAPFNEELAKLLQDDRFLYKDKHQ